MKTIKNAFTITKTIFRSKQRFKSKVHNIFTEEATKIALSSNDHKRLQNFGGIASYPYGINAGKVCKAELLKDINIK